MKELSLNILDITQNSITAGAKHIDLLVDSSDEYIRFQISDDGCGMDREMLEKVFDPFTTTRTTRKIGLGLPLLKEAAEQTGGDLQIESKPGLGTKLCARFVKNNIDCPPLGDMPSTISMIVQSIDEDLEFSYKRVTSKGVFDFSTEEIKQVLGSDISLHEPEILLWISDYVRENEADIQ